MHIDDEEGATDFSSKVEDDRRNSIDLLACQEAEDK
jgi:hypothetical protein